MTQDTDVRDDRGQPAPRRHRDSPIYGHWGCRWASTARPLWSVSREATGCLYLLTRCRFHASLLPPVRFDLIRTIWHVGAPVSGERVVQQAGILLYTEDCVDVAALSPMRPTRSACRLSPFVVSSGYGFAIAAATMVGTEHRRRQVHPGEAGNLGSGTGWPPI